MRSALQFLLFIVTMAIASPESDMNSIIDALYQADGETVFRGLSNENQEALAMIVAMVRLAPDQVATQLRSELDVQLSSSEVSTLTEQGLISVIVDSPFFRREIPSSRDMINCENFTMRGDTALVFISIVNEDSIYSYPMLLQEGTWRIAGDLFGGS